MHSLADWTARPRPARITIEGLYSRLEPLDPARHGAALFESSMGAGAEERFRYLFDTPLSRSEFEAWLARSAASQDPLFFGVIDLATHRCEGRQTLMRITPEHGVIEIGNVLWNPPIARSRVATEALFLQASYVFDALGYRRFEWKCNDRNEGSMRAARRFGFTYEGTFRQHMVQKGQNRDTAWFAMTDADWPPVREAFKAWLDPGNFDSDGRQKARLEELRDA